MDIDSEEQSSERTELHFLAAMMDELMKALLANGVMDRRQLQAIEDAAATGSAASRELGDVYFR